MTTKRLIKWNKPEIRNCQDNNGRDAAGSSEFENFIAETISSIAEIQPTFVSLGGQFRELEKNGLYVGSTVLPMKSVRKSLINKLNTSAGEISEYVGNIGNTSIYPGNISLLMDSGNKGVIIFSAFKDVNSIAMIDLFTPLYTATRDGNKRQTARLKTFIKILFSFSRKNFEDPAKIKFSLQEIHEELLKIGIGADPEFSIVAKGNTENFVNAHTLIKSQFDFPIGADGHASILEVRPEPSTDVMKFCSNVEDILKETSELLDITQYDLMTGGGAFRGEPLGGHIHFNIKPNIDLLNMLDDFIGGPIRNCKGGKRAQANSNYDLLGAWRSQPHGFEYRTPPSFFINKKFTESVYIIAHLVAKTYKFYQKTQQDFEYNTPISLDDLKKLVDYDKFEDEINYYFNFINSKSNISGYVFENWNITKLKKDQTFNVKIVKSEDKMINDLVKLNSIEVYRPPFNEIKFYGISESTAPFSAINIDSTYIDSNVNLGFLHKWLRDYVRDISITNFIEKDENIQQFIEKGTLSIGLTMKFRTILAGLDERQRNDLITNFIKKLCVYIRVAIKDNLLLDKENAQEVKEYETIKKLIDRKK